MTLQFWPARLVCPTLFTSNKKILEYVAKGCPDAYPWAHIHSVMEKLISSWEFQPKFYDLNSLELGEIPSACPDPSKPKSGF